MRKIRWARCGMMLASELSNARSKRAGIRFLALGGDDRHHHPGLRAIGDRARQVQEQAPANRQDVQLVLLWQVAGADMGEGVGTLLLELVEFRGQRVGVSRRAGGGVAVVLLEGLGETIAGRPLPSGCEAA